MIVPMKKYSFLIFYQESAAFVQNLMQLGVVHVINKGPFDDADTTRLLFDIRETNQVLKNFDKRRKKNEPPRDLEKNMPPIDVISALERNAENLTHKIETLDAEIKLMKPWGEFSWQQIANLETKAGLDVRFFRHSKRSFEKDWHKCENLVEVNREGAYVYFIVFSPDLESLPNVPLALPKQSLSQLQTQRDACAAELQLIEDELNMYASRYHAKLKNLMAEAKDELALHEATIGMSNAADNKVQLLQGWCPASLEADLTHFLQKNQVVFVAEKPNEDELPPVMLKNNRFAKLFEPIGNLFSLPHYSELDMTILFAPFFLLFFGFCLGDAGYGIVMLLTATLLKFKIKKTYHSYLTLLQLFGTSTAVIGFFTGTLFGIEMAKNSNFLSMSHLFLDQKSMFRVALIIGFVQIIFGLGVNAYKQIIFKGWLHAISRFGWIVLLISLGDYLYLEWSPFISSITAIIGGVMIIGFGAPDQGWLKSIGYGLADLYNITGVAGDLLSYIRLFALGVSSAILGLVVNSIALSAKDIPYVGVVLFVLMLVVGHGANLLLASLSAFVHPMRLTFVEFYKNAGFLGGGKPYKPLAREAKEKL